MTNEKRVSIFHALVSPILLAGVPRTFAILNGTVCAAFVLALQSLYVLPICIGLHIAMVILTKKDPDAFDVMLRHLKQKTYYDV